MSNGRGDLDVAEEFFDSDICLQKFTLRNKMGDVG
jgi:hypothetical protein